MVSMLGVVWGHLESVQARVPAIRAIFVVV
jgi:hypothetical protein